MLVKISTLGFLVFLAAACGDGTMKQARRNPSRPYGYFGLVGTWENGCLTSGKTNSNKDVISVSEKVYSTEFTYYRGVDCQAAQADYTYAYDFVDPSEVPSGLDGYKSFIHSASSVSLTLKSEAFVKAFNRNRRYGLSDWELNETRSVSGLRFDETSRELLAEKDTQRLNINVDGDSLAFAELREGAWSISESPSLSFRRVDR